MFLAFPTYTTVPALSRNRYTAGVGGHWHRSAPNFLSNNVISADTRVNAGKWAKKIEGRHGVSPHTVMHPQFTHVRMDVVWRISLSVCGGNWV